MEDSRSAISNLNPSVIKQVRIANSQTISTTGSGLINGMVAYIGPFHTNLISVSALLTIGVHPIFDLYDPHMLLQNGERFGELIYTGAGGFWAKIPLTRKSPMPWASNGGIEHIIYIFI